jgi:ubiquinone biosynthesis protein
VEILVNKGLRLSPDLFLLVKALITIEGVATALDPQFDFSAHLQPFVQELVRERLNPERIKKHISTAAGDYSDLLQSVPGDYYRIVDSIASGQVRGSAVIVHSRVPPLWHEIPVIGIVGFVAAGLLGFWLLIKIIRTGGI